MLNKIRNSSIAKSFVKSAESGKLNGHYNTDPLGMLDSDKVLFSCWSENFFDGGDIGASP